MLKSTIPNAGLWVCPNTGHAINLEEPLAFNAQVESFLSAVERGSWRRRYLSTQSRSNFTRIDMPAETVQPARPIRIPRFNCKTAETRPAAQAERAFRVTDQADRVLDEYPP